jgi:hypothetical protein
MVPEGRRTMNEDMYMRETKEGEKHGIGLYFGANNDICYAQWEEGKQIGKGIIFCNDGSIKIENYVHFSLPLSFEIELLSLLLFPQTRQLVI